MLVLAISIVTFEQNI